MKRLFDIVDIKVAIRKGEITPVRLGNEIYIENQAGERIFVFDLATDSKFIVLNTELEGMTNLLKAYSKTEIGQIKSVPLVPIYTSGRHGYEDDDDEDFWCPVCHEHLGDHRGFETKCHRCGQAIEEEWDKSYSYHEMLKSNEQKAETFKRT